MENVASASKARRRANTKSAKSVLPHDLVEASERGWRLFPVAIKGKVPLVKWIHEATGDLPKLEAWAKHHRNCNWGMSTGKGSGVFVLDIDGPRREASLAAWKAAGLMLPKSRTHRTGKGRHVLFQWPESHDIRNSVSKVAPGIDVRGEGGYVVIPPSIHASGAAYEVIDDRAPAEMPEWLLYLSTAVGLKAGGAPWDGEIPAGRRNDTLASFAGSLRRHGMHQEAILSVLRAVNAVRCEPPLDDRELQTISHSIAGYTSRNDVQEVLNDARPKVLLPGENRLMSDCATELSEHLSDALYAHNNEVVQLKGASLCPVSTQTFRTLVEQSVVCCRKRRLNGIAVDVGVTMSESEARGILASPQFRKHLRPLKRINSCRMPARRASGSIELLPEGYDAETPTMTVSSVKYADDTSIDSAVKTLDDLFDEFVFADDRSKAVAVSAMVGLYAAQLVPEGELRPAFTLTKNAEGAGATTLTACAVVTILGHMPTGVIASDDAEIRKTLTAAIREGRPGASSGQCKGPY